MTKIKQLIVQGDSLSDRGTLNKRKLLGFIPMSYLSGLSGKSPKGRFTNGYLWGDFVAATTIQQFEINHLRKKLKLAHNASANADISDECLVNIERTEQDFNLDNDLHVLYKGRRFARYYCQGGLTSYDYSSSFILDPTKAVPRLIIPNLSDMRHTLLTDDRKYRVRKKDKAETLVIEWSGANDLITVNYEPNHEEVDKAVAERIHNLEQLIVHGYRNLILFNLPDLGLTPRYQAKPSEERANATECSEYFNTQLATQCAALNKKYKELDIELNLSIFDVAAQFKKIYANPEQYGFDPQKLKSPFTLSEDFAKDQSNKENQKKQLSPSEGYMFWDDVHPTADMHSWLAVEFQKKYQSVFEFIQPSAQGKARCHDDGDNRLRTPRFFGSPRKSTPKIELPEDLETILDALLSNAKSMCTSTSLIRHKKGELLKELIFDLKCQRGNLKAMHGFLSAFVLDTENMDIIKTHHNPIWDFIFWKKTTRSEDLLAALRDTLERYLRPEASLVSS